MHIGLRLFTLIHRFRRMQLDERLGLLPRSEHMILELLLSCEEGGETLSAAAMARQLRISPPAVSRTVRGLRARGLIVVESDPVDRRGIRIRITREGSEILKRDRARLDALLEKAAGRLAPGELDRFFDIFDRLCIAVSAELDAADEEARKAP